MFVIRVGSHYNVSMHIFYIVLDLLRWKSNPCLAFCFRHTLRPPRGKQFRALLKNTINCQAQTRCPFRTFMVMVIITVKSRLVGRDGKLYLFNEWCFPTSTFNVLKTLWFIITLSKNKPKSVTTRKGERVIIDSQSFIRKRPLKPIR